MRWTLKSPVCVFASAVMTSAYGLRAPGLGGGLGGVLVSVGFVSAGFAGGVGVWAAVGRAAGSSASEAQNMRSKANLMAQFSPDLAGINAIGLKFESSWTSGV